MESTLNIPLSNPWQDQAQSSADAIAQFVNKYTSLKSKQPVDDGYTRGFYSCLFMQLEASPAIWLLLPKAVQNSLNAVKHMIDDHYHITDNKWPPHIDSQNPPAATAKGKQAAG